MDGMKVTKEELFGRKEFISVADIQVMYECGYTKACGIIRAIKNISDTLGLRGKVTVNDYMRWYNHYHEQTQKI